MKNINAICCMVILGIILVLGACQPISAVQPNIPAQTTLAGISNEDDREVILIGVNETMSGWGSPYGEMTWKGIQLAHEQRPSVLGKPIELVLVDNKSNQEHTAVVTRRLVEVDKVVAVIGVNSSTMAITQNEILDKVPLPSLCSACTSPLVTQGKPYAFGVSTTDALQGETAARFAVEELHAKTAVLLVDIAIDDSVELANYFRSNFIALTGNDQSILGYYSFLTGNTDFSTQLEAIKKINPDIIFAPNKATEEIQFLKQARGLGITTPVLGGDALDIPELLGLGGSHVEGLFFTSQFHPQAYTHPEALAFTNNFIEAYSSQPETFSATGYDAYMVLVSAIERTGATDATGIHDALEQTDTISVRGPLKFDENHNVFINCLIIEIKNGVKTIRYIIESQ